MDSIYNWFTLACLLASFILGRLERRKNRQWKIQMIKERNKAWT